MINFKIAQVMEVTERFDDISYLLVQMGDKVDKAINYNHLTGEVQKGDRVKVNTTALDLGLGTGGYHFVMDNQSRTVNQSKTQGHIMKVRYTPMQVKCFTVEEDEGYRSVFSNFKSLLGLPVVVGELHSMVAPIAAILKYKKPNLNICYIMTDGGALPLALSNSIRQLKSLRIINSTITFGHAFGGDYEAVNIYTALIIAKEIVKCDVAIVTMGPGIVGTGTKYGFSGIEQGYILDGVSTLGGSSILVPRISFGDSRERHQGISHHTLTVLGSICKTRTSIFFPRLDEGKMNRIKEQLLESKIGEKHSISINDPFDINELEKIYNHYEIRVKTMGRGIREDMDYFLTLASCAKSLI